MEDDFEPAGEEASDNECEEDNDEYETMTVTDAGDNFNEQVREDPVQINILEKVPFYFPS
jgi:hypothetical protein